MCWCDAPTLRAEPPDRSLPYSLVHELDERNRIHEWQVLPQAAAHEYDRERRLLVGYCRKRPPHRGTLLPFAYGVSNGAPCQKPTFNVRPTGIWERQKLVTSGCKRGLSRQPPIAPLAQAA